MQRNRRKIYVFSNTFAWIMAAFLFFGNPLVLGKLLYMGMGFSSDLNNYHWLTYDYLMAQYSTNFVLMRWTFPQCIVPWIVMAMLMEGDNDVDSYVVIGLPVILFATFPFLAIVIYMIVLAVKKFLSQNDKKAFLLKCFSKENLLCFLSLGTFSFCYYISYFLTKEKPESLKLSFVFSWSRQFLVTYGVFVVFTFGLYAILLLKYEKKNLFLNSSIVILLVLPLFQFGGWNDFVMRVSIPSLFVICVLTLKRIFEASFKHKGYKLALLAVYLCGMYYPVRELTDVVRQDTIILWQEPFDSYYTLELFANPKARELDEYLSGYGDDVIWNYFTYDAKDSFFLKTIGKKIP